jgi:hypothetical protein
VPASERSLRLTDAYRARLLDVRARVAIMTGRSWQQIPLDALDSGFAAWQAQTAGIITAAQSAGVALAGVYVAGYVASELDTAPDLSPRAARDDGSPQIVGIGRDGRSLAQVLAPALFTVKRAIAEGRGDRRALQMGLHRAARTISNEVTAAPRAAQDLAMRAEPKILGWRRATRPGACLACFAAATGAIQKTEVTLRVHGHCTCFKEPVVRGVRERVQRPTGQEMFDAMSSASQNARYGVAKSELIRSGEVPLEALEHRQPMATVPDEITETPLSALR